MVIKKYYNEKQQRYFWHINVTVDGKQYKKLGFRSKGEAEEFIADLRTAARNRRYGIGVQVVHSPSLYELFEKRLESFTKRAERTRSKRVFNTMLDCVDEGIKITDVTTADLRTFVQKREADGLRASSINRELNILSATLHLAKDYWPQLSQWITPKIPRPKHAKRRRERLWSQEEFANVTSYLLGPRKLGELLHAMDARHRVGHVLQFMALTAARTGEVFWLRWVDISWTGRTVKLTGTKTDRNRTVPLTESIERLLRKRQAVSRDEFVFSRGGKPTPKFYRILRKACEACGIVYGRNIEGGLIAYDNRHTAATRMLQSGVDLATVGAMLGHSDKTMTLHYSHATHESLRRAGEALEGKEA